MARSRFNPSQPNDASQEAQRGENPMEREEAKTLEKWERLRWLELKKLWSARNIPPVNGAARRVHADSQFQWMRMELPI
jgi:hypothetical protein